MQLGCNSLHQTLELLKEPAKLTPGLADKNFSVTRFSNETDFGVIVRVVESYRKLRVEAGEELA